MYCFKQKAFFVLLVVLLFPDVGCIDKAYAAEESENEISKLFSIFSQSNDRSEIFSEKRAERNALLGEIDELRSQLKTKEIKLKELYEQRNFGFVNPAVSRRASQEILNLDETIRRLNFDSENERQRDELDRKRIEKRILDLQNSNDIIDSQEKIAKLEDDLEQIKIFAISRDNKSKFELENLNQRRLFLLEQKQQEEKNRQESIAAIEENQKKFENEISDLERSSSELRQSIRKKQENLDKINDQIAQLIDVSDADLSFRLRISVMFAALVFIVILGFFLIIRSNDNIIFEIFSKDSGIQFITLFSIVIAIILFGITGVLEGKELAALLAGLSGYILGRGSGVNKAPLPTGGDRQ